MKKSILNLVAIFIASLSFAQGGGFNYKALITDNGNVLNTQPVTFKFTVLENGTTAVYQETQSGTTDANGIIAINVGEGTLVSGNFSTIDWGSNPYFLKVEIDTGSGYQDFGTTEFKAVPYAKFAEKAGNAFSGDFSDLSNVPAGLSDGDDDTHLTDAQITAMGYIKNANDADHDATNEIQNLTLNSTQLSISNGNNVNFTGWDTNAADDFDGDFTSLSNVPAGLSDGDDDTHLTETQVDNYVANNGYISLNSADATTLEIQNNSTSGIVNGVDILVNSNDNSKFGVNINLQGTTQTNVLSSAIRIRNELVSSQSQFGIYNQFSGSSTTPSYKATGLYNFVDSGSGYLGTVIGVSNRIDSNHDGLHEGIFTIIDNSGNGLHYGNNNIIKGTGNGDHIGVYSELSGTGTGDHYGSKISLFGSGSGPQFGTYQDITISGDGLHIGTKTIINGSGSGSHYGTRNQLSGAGTGDQYGVSNYIDNSGDGDHYANKSYLNGGGSGIHFGTFNQLSGAGTGYQYGTSNKIDNSGNGTHYGSHSELSGSGSGIHYGNFNYLSGLGNGEQFGTKNYIINTGSGDHYGSSSVLAGSGSGNQFGIVNEISNSGAGDHFGNAITLNGNGPGAHYGTINTLYGSGSGIQYGTKNSITNLGNNTHYGVYNYLSGSGTGIKYGSYNRIPLTAGGTHYAVYGSALKAGSYAGYFMGNVYTSKKLKAPDSGDTDMKAYIYGSITSGGGYSSVGAHSGGFSVTRTSTGVYQITFTGSNKPTSAGQYTVMVNMRAGSIGFITVQNNSSTFIVKTFSTTVTAANRPFNFVVYKK